MNKKDINQRISNRTDCFLWQTDRKISAKETKDIWKDRHSSISNEELLQKVNSLLTDIKLEKIYPINKNSQTNSGNINSIRIGRLTNGKEVVIRCHPRGIKNGYFHVESLASALAKANNLPAYTTHLIHDLEDENDISFQVIEKLEGKIINFYLQDKPADEEKIVFEIGKTLAKLNKIKVRGFGPFSNEYAKQGVLEGTYTHLKNAVLAGLEENLNRLVYYKVINNNVAKNISKLFKSTRLLNDKQAVLIHNDSVDWNVLTNGNEITGLLDWDECVGGCIEEEIACWSSFFPRERLKLFLKGYFSETEKPHNFEEKLNLLRLRYVISKMALRLKRFTYEKSAFVKNLLKTGKEHLEYLINLFNLDN